MARVSLVTSDSLIAVAFSDVVLLFDDDNSTKEPLILKHVGSDSSNGKEDSVVSVVSMAINADRSVVVVVYSDKTVSCFHGSDGKLLASQQMPKKLASCAIVPLPDYSKAGSEALLVGDKTGDVYALSFPTLENRKLMLGHTASIITSMSLIPSATASHNHLLATSDRDEKIRISYWPQTSLIHSFCLGHVEYVSAISSVSADKPLLSISGDGTLKAWDLDGKCQATWEGEDGAGQALPIAMARSCTTEGFSDLLVVALANQPSLTFLDLSNFTKKDDRAKECNSPPLFQLSNKLDIEAKPSNMCFYDSGNKLIVQIDQAPYVLLFERNEDKFVLNTTNTLSSRVNSIVEKNGFSVLSALSLDDNELNDANITAEPIATDDAAADDTTSAVDDSSVGFAAGANELRKRVLSRPCHDWNSRKRLTVLAVPKKTADEK